MTSWLRLAWAGACVFLWTTRLFATSEISLSSVAFRTGEKIPENFTCKGANVSPPLQFPGVPGEARSLVLVVEDPDAPTGLFTHWLVWNIEPNHSTNCGGEFSCGRRGGHK